MARRKRLLISDIDSVGGVDAGDNPGAALLFWKRKKNTPDAGGEPEGVLMDPTEIEVEKTEPEPEPEVVKAEPEPEVEKRADEEIVKARAERDAAVAALAEEVEKRETSEWVEKAKTFEMLLGDPVRIGPALRKLHQAAPDAYETLEPVLRAARNRETLAKILTEYGTDRGEGTPFEQRDAYVAEMRKLHPEMSPAQARAQFWHDHPEARQASRA